jgi:hypothetical protein
LVNYDQPNPAENDISNWLIQNPQRVNLGTIGLSFDGVDITEDMLESKFQTLDLWTGKISSSFTYNGADVVVETWSDAQSDTVGTIIESTLLSTGALGVFIDFALPTRNKFDAPFVGVFNATQNHTTTLDSNSQGATIRHDLDATTYYASVKWNQQAEISGPIDNTHRYILQPSKGVNKLELSTSFSPLSRPPVPSFDDIISASTNWWESYWTSGAFIDLTSSSSPNATELQRITILSQYLVAVNSASSNPPQGKYQRANFGITAN